MYLAPGLFTNGQLYNCCTNAQEPDWNQYIQLEVRPVKEQPAADGDETDCETLPLDKAEWADFWSVYARLQSGEVEVITDSKSEFTIHQIGHYLSTRSGLPLR